MVAIDIGRVCKKLTGREAGRFCVVIDTVDEGYCMVTGPKNVSGVKRRQCNILHLEPTGDVLEIKKGASDEEVKAAIDKAGLGEKLKNKHAREASEASEKPEKPKKEKKAAKEEKPRKDEAKEEKKEAKEEKPKKSPAKKKKGE